MSLGDVNMNLTDGGLGNVASGTDGIHAKVGVAEGGDINTVYSATSYPEIKSILIAGPLLDRFDQFYREFNTSKKQKPPKVYFVKATGDVPGSVETPAHVGTGAATFETSGSPLSDRKMLIEVLAGGACGAATYRKSIDGGKSWSDELTFPASGVSLLIGTGVSIAFTDAATPAESFVQGDVYTIETNGPGASNESRLSAIAVLRQEHEVRFIHVIGGSTKAFWASLGVVADEWDVQYKHPVFFIAEATARTSESVSEWALARINEAKGFSHKRVLKVCQSGDDSDTAETKNLAVILSAKLAAGRVHESPGFVDKFAFLSVSALTDYSELSKKENGSSFLDALDDNNYVCAVEYEDYEGFFFGDGNTCADETSDFQTIEILRPADKLRRMGRQAIMGFLKSPAHAEAGLGGIVSLTVTLDNAIGQEMEKKGDREIVSHTTMIDENQDVLGTGKVSGKVSFVPIGSMKEIDLDISASKE